MKVISHQDSKVLMIAVNREEALQLIRSLTNQLLSKHPNVGREEHYAEDGTYVSIGVAPDIAGDVHQPAGEECIRRIEYTCKSP